METLTKESTSTNVKEVNKKESGSELVERWQIPNSPFTVITIEGERHFGVMGEYRVTEEMKSRGEVEDELKCITWNRIIQVMMILEEIRKKDKDFDKKVNKELETNTNNKKN
jgi:hypothetical protein